MFSQLNSRLYFTTYMPCGKGFFVEKSKIPVPHFIFIHKGKGTVFINEQKFKANEGDLFFCPFFSNYSMRSNDFAPFTISTIEFEFIENKPDYTPFPIASHMNFFADKKFMTILFEIIDKYIKYDAIYDEYIHLLFKALFLIIFKLPKDRSKKNALANRIAYYIENTKYHTLTLDEISKVFGYHPNYLNRIFKAAYDKTIVEYSTYTRLNRATELIKTNLYTIKEVANLCGYDDLNYFSRIFRQKIGVSPSQIKKTDSSAT